MVPDQDEFVRFLIDKVREILNRSNDNDVTINKTTCIFGNKGVLSSLEIVELMLSIEDFCHDNNLEFSWTHDSLMSSEYSPYRSIAVLAEFVYDMQVRQKAI